MESTYNYIVFPVQGSSLNAPDPGGAANPSTNNWVNAWVGIPEYAFGTGTKIIMVFVHNNRLVLRWRFSADADWGDPIILWDAPQAEPFYHSAQYFQVMNYVPGSTALWQVIGQW